MPKESRWCGVNYINSRQKLFSHIDKLQEMKLTGSTSAPVNVEIDLSNRCSHGCNWCHFAFTHTRGPLAGKRDKPEGAILGGDLMDYDLAYSILPQLKKAGVKSITWTGGGEPTLHPRFMDIVGVAAWLGLEQGLYTHGGHITPALADLLKQELTFVYVSLDECTPESFKASKGVDRFSKVIEGIKFLVAAVGNATIGIGFLLHTGNYNRVDEMVALGKSLGADYMQFRPIIAYDQVAPGQLVEDVQWVNSAINNLRKYAGDKRVITDTWRFEMYRDWNGHGYKTCNWSALQTVITPNGKVWRCTNKREHPEALLGDLSVNSFYYIWEKAGSPCTVDAKCRVMCRGHIANITLDSVLSESSHSNFI